MSDPSVHEDVLDEKPVHQPSDQSDDEAKVAPEEYPHGAKLVAIVGAVVLGTFLIALDNTIVSTAIPKITDEFDDLSELSWYGAAYFMTFGGFQSMWGKLYRYFPLKLWFIISMLIFELGSLLCGVAPNATTLILGRAIAGLGGAGVAAGAFTVIGFIAPPEKRPTLLGLTGATYGISAVLGPILGGVFADKVSWRWSRCFYINLPIGGVAVVLVALFFHMPDSAKPAEATWKEKFLQMDFLGTILIIGFITSFLLALEYGGQTKAWNSSTVIGLLVGSPVMVMVFLAWEWHQKERATVVPRLMAQRHVWVGGLFMFFFAGGYFTILYYLPIYFQSIKNTSPIESGVRMLALIIPLTIVAIIQGPTLAKIGIAPVFWIVGAALMSVACGLFYTMNENTSTGKWIGYQIIAGVGAAWAFQTATAVAQVKARPEDMSQVTAIIFFCMMLGGAGLLSGADSAFNNRLLITLHKLAPEITAAEALGTGATSIRTAFTEAQIPAIIESYLVGLRAVWALCAASFAIATLVGFLGSWERIGAEELKAVGGAA